MSAIQHQQLVLRVPDELAERITAILNTENGQMSININPIEGKVDHYEFHLHDETYPALLQNLPCMVESHKSADMKIFYKAGDIGQILYVYLNEKELQQGLQDLKIVDDVSYCSHGLTPPTKNIVQKKFLKSREQQNYTNDRIQMIVDQIKVLDMKDKVHKEVIEEVVDFEDWMVDTIHGEGIKLHFGGDKWLQCNNNILLEHPSLFDCQYWIETEKKTSTASSKPLEKAETKEEIVSSSDGEEEAEGSEGSDESWLHEVEKEVSSAADGANKAGDDNLEWLQDVDVDE